MTQWAQKSALEGRQIDSEPACLGSSELCVRELPVSEKLILQTSGDLATICQIVDSHLGWELPRKINSFTAGQPSILCLGPCKWMLISNSDQAHGWRHPLENALSEIPCLISNIGDARFGFEISGNLARTLLSRVCALDLSSRNFKAGQCAQTLLVRAPLLLLQLDELPTYQLYVDRSLATYAWDWLSDAASELLSAGNRV